MTHFNAYNGTFIFRSLDKYLDYVRFKKPTEDGTQVPNEPEVALKRAEEIINAFHNELVRVRKQSKEELLKNKANKNKIYKEKRYETTKEPFNGISKEELTAQTDE